MHIWPEQTGSNYATLHRAFDLCKDPVSGLEDVIAYGASRLLTYGRRNKARDGIELIRKG